MSHYAKYLHNLKLKEDIITFIELHKNATELLVFYNKHQKILNYIFFTAA